MNKKILIQTQLSNYDTNGKFILEADSGYQMCMGRVRELLKIYKNIEIDITLPLRSQLLTQPEEINPDLWCGNNRLQGIHLNIMPNALATRYDFNVNEYAKNLLLFSHKNKTLKHYDFVYINDPMLLRNFRALFHLYAGYIPKFYVHSHFIDNPECPKFPIDASLWLGQCEAAIKADFNFWQCESSMNVFFESFKKTFNNNVLLNEIKNKSLPWDDGYSHEEITTPPEIKNVRFSSSIFNDWKRKNKKIIFVPNRIGGMGRSSDYTNCGKFMFEILPRLYEHSNDFIVIAGNPSQKFTNQELGQLCSKYGYKSIVNGSLNRDEYKVVASNADYTVGLYDQDTYGGTAARECIALGSIPIWINVNEYERLALKANWEYIAKYDCKWTDNIVTLIMQMHNAEKQVIFNKLKILQSVIKNDCSYESTTKNISKVLV